MTMMTASQHRPPHRAGSAAVEFALIGPLMIVMIMGMVVYGGWMWLAQSVQTLATEGARAAVAGLDATERARLVNAFVDSEIGRVGGLSRDRLSVAVESDTQVIRVRLAFDVRDHPLMAFSVLLPPPPMVIQRTAVVRTGGF